MRKILMLMLLPVMLWSCSKDDEPKADKFPSGVSNVLDVLQGTWVSDETDNTLTFAPYSEPRKVQPANASWTPLQVYGTLQRDYYYRGTPETENYYFLVNVDKKEIHAYGITENGSYTIVTSKSYDYEIINNATIRLHDKSLSWFNAHTYTKE